MQISLERLTFESEATGFRPEILEKVLYLIHLLNQFAQDDYLKDRFVLKGGTALNLFYFNYPRLSVDIDINYIGSADRTIMLQEKTHVETCIEAIILDKKFILSRKPTEHAGGKWQIRYPSAIRGQGVIEIDLNYLERVPLWPIRKLDSYALGSFQAIKIPVQDIHDIASGKLRALFSRHSSRDLFDVHQLLTCPAIESETLRLGFIVYGAASRTDWRTIQINDIQFNWQEFQNMLIPLLKKTELMQQTNPKLWAENILKECKTALAQFLPLRSKEITFLNKLLDEGYCDAAVLTNNAALKSNIMENPAIQWKAINAKLNKDNR